MQIKTTPEILQLVSTHTNKDSLLYFLHLIIKRNTNQRIYLSSQALKKTFGDRTYKKLVVNQLIELGIIEEFRNYRETGFYYLTYKILLSYSKKDVIDYEITDTRLIQRIEDIIENNYEKLEPHIKQVLNNLDKLIITPELFSELKKDGVPLEDEINFTANNKFKARINQSPSGRVHHTLTNLNKRYRKKLTSKLGSLVEIDAKNAQLIFLSQLCPNDLIFNADVFEGVFYQKLSSKMGVNISIDAEKSEFKRKFFNTILCNENKAVIANNDYTHAFKSLYPIMFNFLIYLNQDRTKANMLQKMEAEFFITNILKDLGKMNLFVIPIHDAMIVLEKDVNTVKSIIDGHSMAFFKKLITTSTTNYTCCSTPYKSALLIKEETNRIETIRITNNKCIYSANDKGVEQNKNKLKSKETIEKITLAIIKINEEGSKMTTRNIQAKAGVSTASINKHYKAILTDLNRNKAEVVVEVAEGKIEKPKPYNEVKTIYTLPDNILNEFLRLSETYGFPKDIAEIYIDHINKVGFESIEEMLDEVNSNPILKHLLNTKQTA